MKEINEKIGCIIVLYNPDLGVLSKVLNTISKQVSEVFILDNSAQKIEMDTFPKNITYHFIGENVGIAKAQNIGITYFEQKRYNYIIFLDQDSIPPDNMINNLYYSYQYLTSKNIKIGAVGPRPFNREQKRVYRGNIKKGKKIANNTTEVTEIISSASFFPIQNFSIVGGMEEDLFIDGVDHEWCWRAKKKANLRFFIIENILLSHQLGEGDRNFLFVKVAIPTPFRTYFQFRNYFRLVKRDYVPLYWKLSNGIKYIIKYFYFPLMISPRREYFKRINKGILSGIFS